MVKSLCNNDAVDTETYVYKPAHSPFKMTFIIPVSYYSGGSRGRQKTVIQKQKGLGFCTLPVHACLLCGVAER